MELGYAGQFSSHTTFKTEDYSFAGQRLNGGNTGAGLEAQFTSAWSASAGISTSFGYYIRQWYFRREVPLLTVSCAEGIVRKHSKSISNRRPIYGGGAICGFGIIQLLNRFCRK